MNKQEFKALNNKMLVALKEHPNIVEAGVEVSHYLNPFYGDVFKIGDEDYTLSNDGDVAEWKRIK